MNRSPAAKGGGGSGCLAIWLPRSLFEAGAAPHVIECAIRIKGGMNGNDFGFR
jgi:hypothetical protein